MDYEATDKAALYQALLALHTCPHCRADLQPVALCADVWGCQGNGARPHPVETWHIPADR